MYTETDFVRIAKRENNKKRNYLVVNRLQGKHIPVSPKAAFQVFDTLAGKLEHVYRNEKLLFIGFAETATAIGARIAVRLNSYYMQTTREQVKGTDYIFFSEAHSHATEQRLVRDDIEALIGKVDRIVFVEDEVTTGNTILNIIQKLQELYPTWVKFAVASLLNGMNEEALLRYAQKQIDLHYLVKTNHDGYGRMAEAYSEDGTYISLQNKKSSAVEQYFANDYINTRRYTTGAAYQNACLSLWNQIKDTVLPKQSEHILVIGTEEFMYPALFVGACLEDFGNHVVCHSTTRSPIAVSRQSNYPLHDRYELASFYQKDRRTFIYDLKKYDRVLIITDAIDNLEEGTSFLVSALRSCGNENIQIFRWGENR